MAEQNREMVFLANSHARLGREGAESAKAALDSEGFDVKQFVVTESEAEFEQRLREFVRQKEAVIAVGGGDGTQRSAAEILAGTESAMAVVPLGTGNAWATDLGIPVGPQQTAKALAGAEEKLIDVGLANGRVFVNVATVGLTSLIAKNLQEGSKGRLGKAAYLPAVVRSIGKVRPFWLKVKTDEGEFEDRVLQFVAAAGRTHAGPFPVTKHAENDDGKLSLYALHEVGRPGLVKFGWALLRGRHGDLDEVWCCESTVAVVTTKPRMEVIADGEPVGRTPLTLGIRPGALKVLAPPVAKTAV